MRLTIDHITKQFGALRANDDLSFTFESGYIYAILGENGAGKSTLMKILSGFQNPTAGQLLIDDRPVAFHSPEDAIGCGIGMLYQDPLDFPPLTVLENYTCGRPRTFLLRRDEVRAELLRNSAALGFKLNPAALVETLTVGERQQLEIVRLLSLGVRFLILDEPTTGISAEQKQQLFSTLKNLAREKDMTILLVSHKLQDVEDLCDEVLVLRQGKLVGREALPCPTARLVELMFGKALENETPPPPPRGVPVLEVAHLPVRTRLFTIPQVKFTLHAGEVIGLAGLDGSGQVELMREIAGVQRPTWRDYLVALIAFVLLAAVFFKLLEESPAVRALAWGAAALLIGIPPLFQFVRWIQLRMAAAQAPIVKLADAPIAGRGYRELLRRGIIYLSAGRTEEGLVGGLTLLEHQALVTPTRLPVINWLAMWRAIRERITRFNIKGRPLLPVQKLSGGNQQRLALALLPDELRVLFLDNPMRGLDVESAARIWSFLLERRARGTAIIFASPDLDEVIEYSDRVLVFSAGNVTLVEDPAALTTAHLGQLIGGKPAAPMATTQTQ